MLATLSTLDGFPHLHSVLTSVPTLIDLSIAFLRERKRNQNSLAVEVDLPSESRPLCHRQGRRRGSGRSDYNPVSHDRSVCSKHDYMKRCLRLAIPLAGGRCRRTGVCKRLAGLLALRSFFDSPPNSKRNIDNHRSPLLAEPEIESNPEQNNKTRTEFDIPRLGVRHLAPPL